jgi:hypothetical protein
MRSELESGWWGPLDFEVHPSLIDEFVLADLPDDFSIRWMKGISEEDVKSAIASIASEPFVSKDWGGETSDLYTTRLHLLGSPTRTAFLLKGPSAYHKMTISDLGKNGDQIDRLFQEPADLLVVQHCHEITPAVRRMMEAYAIQRSFQRGVTRFCLLDGPDTYRLLLGSGFVSLHRDGKHGYRPPVQEGFVARFQRRGTGFLKGGQLLHQYRFPPGRFSILTLV